MPKKLSLGETPGNSHSFFAGVSWDDRGSEYRYWTLYELINPVVEGFRNGPGGSGYLLFI